MCAAGAGAISLAEATVHAANKPVTAEIVVCKYLAAQGQDGTHCDANLRRWGVELSSPAEEKLHLLTEQGFGDLPVCIAKTHLSLSHEEKQKGRPRNFKLPIRDVRLAAGAGYVIAFANEIRTMSGMPAHPALEQIEVDENGKIVGLE